MTYTVERVERVSRSEAIYSPPADEGTLPFPCSDVILSSGRAYVRHSAVSLAERVVCIENPSIRISVPEFTPPACIVENFKNYTEKERSFEFIESLKQHNLQLAFDLLKSGTIHQKAMQEGLTSDYQKIVDEILNRDLIPETVSSVLKKAIMANKRELFNKFKVKNLISPTQIEELSVFAARFKKPFFVFQLIEKSILMPTIANEILLYFIHHEELESVRKLIDEQRISSEVIQRAINETVRKCQPTILDLLLKKYRPPAASLSEAIQEAETLGFTAISAILLSYICPVVIKQKPSSCCIIA